MLNLDLSELDELVLKLKNTPAVEEIVDVGFMNMLSRVSANTVGDKNHVFKNQFFLLEGSVEYFVRDNEGFVVSQDVEYNSYVYYGSEKHDVKWGGDKWIENVWNRDKDKELKKYQEELIEGLNGYFT